ncbi:MAG: MFS transporter [Verrucomicrobiota bacterium]
MTADSTLKEPPAKPSLFIYLSIILGALAISLDFASIDLALPALEKEFGLNLESVQWVINGYVIAFAVLMVAGGKFADAYGRKRLFLIGMTIFGIASLLGGCAWSGGSVIAFRVLQGVGAAILWPAMIGMACGALGENKQALALAIIFGTCSIGNAAGPVVGGALTEYFSWRWVLWINVPMTAAAMLMTWFKVPWDQTDDIKPKNDYLGIVLLVTGLVAMMIVVYQYDDWGWTDTRTIVCSVVALTFLVAFPFHENHTAHPLVPPNVLRSPEILTLGFCVLILCQLFFVVLLYVTQYAMKFLGEGPADAGTRVIVFMLAYGAVSFFCQQLYQRFGKRRLLIFGLICGAIAAVSLGIIGPGAEGLSYNLAAVILGIAVGAVLPTANVAAIDYVGTAQAGMISGIMFMIQLAGAAAMLAVSTAVFASVSHSHLNDAFHKENVTLTAAQDADARSIIRGAKTIHQIPPSLTTDIADVIPIIRDAYNAGLRAVFFLSAILVSVALIFTLIFVKHPKAPPPA